MDSNNVRGVPTIKGIGPVHRSSYATQEGGGIVGDIISGVWRWLSPVAKPVGRVVASQALSSGAQMIGDLARREPSQSVQDIMRHHLIEAGPQAMAQRMNNATRQSGSGRRKGKVTSTGPRHLARMLQETLQGSGKKPKQQQRGAGKKRKKPKSVQLESSPCKQLGSGRAKTPKPKRHNHNNRKRSTPGRHSVQPFDILSP